MVGRARRQLHDQARLGHQGFVRESALNQIYEDGLHPPYKLKVEGRDLQSISGETWEDTGQNYPTLRGFPRSGTGVCLIPIVLQRCLSLRGQVLDTNGDHRIPTA